MPVLSLPADKPKILFYGAMMAIQNWSFFFMYFMLWMNIPILPAGECDNMRFWFSFFALDCFLESFCVLWMAMGGYTDSCCMFAFGWFLHLFVALPYCIASVGVPYVLYNNGGDICRSAMGHVGLVVEPVVWVHVCLFLCYVWMMLSITFYSFIKPTFLKKGNKTEVA